LINYYRVHELQQPLAGDYWRDSGKSDVAEAALSICFNEISDASSRRALLELRSPPLKPR
jgi:hypothetical protein